jgi:hypothetical protein
MCLDVQTGLAPLQVFYHAEIASNHVGKPFWVAEGQVIVDRTTYSGNNERDADQFWSQPRMFFVPAYFLPLENLLEIGSRHVRRPPALLNGSRPCLRHGPATR